MKHNSSGTDRGHQLCIAPWQHTHIEKVCDPCRPFVEQHSLDHDDGIEGFSAERVFMLRQRKAVLGGAPAMAMAQIRKDKNTFTLQARFACSP